MVQLYSNMFKLPNQKHKKVAKGRFSHSNEEACPGTPLYRKKLDQGVQAEANDDGTIFISESNPSVTIPPPHSGSIHSQSEGEQN